MITIIIIIIIIIIAHDDCGDGTTNDGYCE